MIPDSVTIEVVLVKRMRMMLVTLDGQVGVALRYRDVIEIRKAETRLRLIECPRRKSCGQLISVEAKVGRPYPRRGIAVLKELRITNFAIIDELHVHFNQGLHVFTGETGAGKSIIIEALSLALGGRASAEMIRSGRTPPPSKRPSTWPAMERLSSWPGRMGST